MINILGTGVSGLVGSRIVELLSEKYNFENLSLETGIDIRDKDQVSKVVRDCKASIILHLAAKADVDGCEKDKSLGENGDAWKINILGTQNLVDAARENKKKIIYISTDFVFDGEHAPYSEEDIPRPINWYGQTKYEGEKIITSSGLPYMIVRIAYPYRAVFALKRDFVRSLLEKLAERQKLLAITDHITTPTFVDDIALALDKLIEESCTGIYHVVGSQFLSPYDAALAIADTFGFPTSQIVKTAREEYFKDRAPRPFNLSLKNDKIQKLGIKMRTFEEGLLEVKKQLEVIS